MGFWKLLVPPEGAPLEGPDRLRITMPPTCVMIGYETVLYFTYNGCLQCKEDPTSEQVLRFLRPASEGNFAVGVLKAPKGNNRGDAQLLLNEAIDKALDLPATTDRKLAVQKYVHTSAPNASVARVLWKRGGGSVTWCISSSAIKAPVAEFQQVAQRTRSPTALNEATGYLINADEPDTCQIFQVSGKNWEEPYQVMGDIARYAERRTKRYHGLVFAELVADFIKDDEGDWNLLQVKAFRCIQQEAVPSGLASTVAWNINNIDKHQLTKCRGDYCGLLTQKEATKNLDKDSVLIDHSRAPSNFEGLRKKKTRDSKIVTAPRAADREALHMIPYRSIVLARAEYTGAEQAFKWQYWHARGAGGEREGRGEWKDYAEVAGGTIEEVAVQRTHRYADIGLNDTVDTKEMVQRTKLTTGETIETPVRRLPPLVASIPGNPLREVSGRARDRHKTVYYDMVPVCQDCLRVYLHKDRKRLLARVVG